MAYDLNPDEVLSYGNRRRQAQQTWSNQTNALGFNSNAADQTYADSLRQATDNWNQSRTRIPSIYSRRGLQDSGIYGENLTRYNTQRNDAFGSLARDYYNQKARYAQQQVGYNQNLWNTMADIDEQERFRRAQIAAQLTGVM